MKYRTFQSEYVTFSAFMNWLGPGRKILRGLFQAVEFQLTNLKV